MYAFDHVDAKKRLMRFAVFTHVEHQVEEGCYFAYAPYVREMNLWFRKVEAVEVVAPIRKADLETGVLAYKADDLYFTQIPSISFVSSGTVFKSLWQLPGIFRNALKTMQRADHIHIRCPGNVGLLACICQIFFPEKPKTAKYAGNWDSKAKQPWTYKLQRWILQNTFLTKNMSVLTYGEWSGQSRNVKPFYTASFTKKTTLKVQEKIFSEPWLFLFVGNLVQGKGLNLALKLVQELQLKGVDCRIEIYGEGPERMFAEAYVEESGTKGVRFKGNRPLEELEEAYQSGHFVILPSKSEGWPKAVAEGMFFGCIPIVTPVSCVPWMLGLTPPAPPLERGGVKKRGILLESDLDTDVERILEVMGDRERMQRMSAAAKEWSQQYTLERFEEGIREVLGVRSPADLADFPQINKKK